MEASPSIITLAYATAILALFMWLCGTITTYVRGRAMESPNREDGAVMNFFNRVFFVPTRDLTVLPDNSEKHSTEVVPLFRPVSSLFKMDQGLV